LDRKLLVLDKIRFSGALKGMLLEDLKLVRVEVKEEKQCKTIKVMTSMVNETQVRKDVEQRKDLVQIITFSLKYFFQYFE
jgi:predicted nucleotidyltransferase